MGKVTSLNNPQLDVIETLDAVKARAAELKADNVLIVIAHNGYTETHVARAMPFTEFAGYLEGAKLAGVMSELSRE